MFASIFICLAILLFNLPPDVSLSDAAYLAGITGHLKAIDLSTDPKNEFTLWSGLIAGLFLMLSYFGCDQSQVQRFLTARSVSESRTSLLMSAFVKIPMQFLILLIGVMVFVFYQFQKPPMIFNQVEAAKLERSALNNEYQTLQSEYDRAFIARQQAATELAKTNPETDALKTARQNYVTTNDALNNIRKRATELVRQNGGNANDVNYVFPSFVTKYMPAGVVGLIIAAIFAAAMSSVAAELSALATATVIDFYKRHLNQDAEDRQYLFAAKLATGFWGIFACIVALYAAQLGSLIEVVNKFGSYFYGSLLGVFVLAIGTKRATANGAFFGLIAGLASVTWVSLRYPKVSFLWYNLLGCVVVVIVGMLLSLTIQNGERERPAH
jgi:Na+/proline symporter